MNFLENVILIIVVAFMAVWICNIKKVETVETIKAKEENSVNEVNTSEVNTSEVSANKVMSANEVSEDARAEMLAGKIEQILRATEKLANKDPSFSFLPNVKDQQVFQITVKDLSEQMLLDDDFDKPNIGEEKYDYHIQLKKAEPTSETAFSNVKVVVESERLTPDYMKKVKRYVIQNYQNGLNSLDKTQESQIKDWIVVLIEPEKKIEQIKMEKVKLHANLISIGQPR